MAKETFEAIVYVQGVGAFVPHTDGSKILFLMPDQDQARENGIRTFNQDPICRHYAVAQFDLRSLSQESPKSWTSIDLSGHWVTVSTDSKKELKLERLTAEEGGVPRLDSVLAAAKIDPDYAQVSPKALPGSQFDPRILKAGLLMDQGVATPVADWIGPFEFHHLRGNKTERVIDTTNFTNVVRFELGPVESFALVLHPFDGGKPRSVPLWPVRNEDVLEIWIRHYCDLQRPDPQRAEVLALEPDPDFALDYSLSHQLEALLEGGAERLPFPRVAASWEKGVGQGGNPNRCMSSQAPASHF